MRATWLIASAVVTLASVTHAQPQPDPAQPQPPPVEPTEPPPAEAQPQQPPPAEPPPAAQPKPPPAPVGPPPPAQQQPAQGAGATAGPALGPKPEVDERPGFLVPRPLFPEERKPPGDPAHPDDLRVGLHGYFRAPLRFSLRERQGEEDASNVHTPWLVDDDYFRSGFLYTPVNESDFTEVYLMAGNTYLTGAVGIMGSLYSDPARPIIDRQLGISQGWVAFRYQPHEQVRVRLKGGAFWDRFGWLEKYDTYIFGRTHQMGGQYQVEVDVWRLTPTITHGFGAHLEAIEANQGLSLLHYLRIGLAFDRRIEVGFHYLRTWTRDQRQLSEIEDGDMDVVGVDARADGDFLGRLYLATSVLSADKANFLSPSIEVMHSNGGRGITENYLGPDSKNGTGALFNVGYQYDFSAARVLKRFAPGVGLPMKGSDVTLSLFGLYSFVGSEQQSEDPAINRDERKYFKSGFELGWWALPFLGVSLRYDRVAPDLDDDPSSFRILSPRISVRANWYADALIYLQWSKYFYGERVGLRPGQVANETLPDDEVWKLQGQITF